MKKEMKEKESYYKNYGTYICIWRLPHPKTSISQGKIRIWRTVTVSGGGGRREERRNRLNRRLYLNRKHTYMEHIMCTAIRQKVNICIRDAKIVRYQSNTIRRHLITTRGKYDDTISWSPKTFGCTYFTSWNKFSVLDSQGRSPKAYDRERSRCSNDKCTIKCETMFTYTVKTRSYWVKNIRKVPRRNIKHTIQSQSGKLRRTD